LGEIALSNNPLTHYRAWFIVSHEMTSKVKLAKLMKNAILFGMGMAMDLSGNAVFAPQTVPPAADMMGRDFKKVGDYLKFAMQAESPTIEKELAARNEQQLKLQLKV
jgi:hypothetical protein